MTAAQAIKAELDQAEHEAERTARRLTAAAQAAEAVRADVRGAIDAHAARRTRARAGARFTRAAQAADAADARLMAARIAVFTIDGATFGADVYQDQAPGRTPGAVS